MADQPDIRIQEMLLEEYRQAWDHYRHVENERNQHVNYFFSVTLATVGFIVAIATSGKLAAPLLLVGVATAAQVYLWIALTLHLNTRKLGLVLSHYLKAIRLLRDNAYRDAPNEVHQLIDRINIYTALSPVFKMRF